MRDPQGVLRTAQENIVRWKPGHRSDGMSVRYLEQWERVIEDGIEAVVEALTGLDEHSSELRQNSPFAGVLPDADRQQILRSFREHWDQTQHSGTHSPQ